MVKMLQVSSLLSQMKSVELGWHTTQKLEVRLCYRYSLDYLNSVILTVGRSNPSKDICLGVRCSKVKGSIICGGFRLYYFSPTRMEMRMTLFFNIDILIFIIYMKKLRASDWLKASAFFM